jgi:hypothetical protein
VKLAGAADLWRIRVRDYRVISTVVAGDLIVTVVKIGNRKDAYRSITTRSRSALLKGSAASPFFGQEC